MSVSRGTSICGGVLAAGLMASAALGQVFTEANGLLITETGAGGVGARTLFRRDAIIAALPGMRIERATIVSEGESISVFLASDRRDILLRIHGEDGWVSMVEGLNPKVYGPGRTQIGMRFSRVGGQHVAYCAPGTEEWSGTVFCGHEPGANLWFAFLPRGWTGPDDELPPPEVLANAELVQIRWIRNPDVTPAGTE